MTRIVIKPVIQQEGSFGWAFRCPGCGDKHVIPVGDGDGPRWGFNGLADKPTFTPSLLVRSGHFAPGNEPPKPCWCQPDENGEDWGFSCYLCHSFITDGRIQFLGDCSHALAGQTVDLPLIED